MSAEIRASVIIASRDRPDELRECLQSIVRAVTIDDEIIVVDSASADPEQIRHLAASSGARLFRAELEGSARARNLGIQNARGRIIAFTDDDARVDLGWLNTLVARFTESDIAAVVGPVFELGNARRDLAISFAQFDSRSDVVRFNRESPDWFARVHYGAIGSGANIAVHRSAFECHGVFRECLGQGAPICGDENYFLLTLIEEGKTVINEPAAIVYHPPQSLARLRYLRRCRFAYVLYILVTRPHLRPSVVRGLVGKTWRRQRLHAKPRTTVAELLMDLITTPGLLLATLRQDRATRKATR